MDIVHVCPDAAPTLDALDARACEAEQARAVVLHSRAQAQRCTLRDRPGHDEPRTPPAPPVAIPCYISTFPRCLDSGLRPRDPRTPVVRRLKRWRTAQEERARPEEPRTRGQVGRPVLAEEEVEVVDLVMDTFPSGRGRHSPPSGADTATDELAGDLGWTGVKSGGTPSPELELKRTAEVEYAIVIKDDDSDGDGPVLSCELVQTSQLQDELELSLGRAMIEAQGHGQLADSIPARKRRRIESVPAS